ncbi:MAG: ApaG domain [Verrucomicrobiota bacterium JB023]|nr:ApaG domain [Verrucomicrobiota bacterium JB023]
MYVPSLETPADKPHPFVYFISIVNDSDENIVLHGRKWVVRESDGETTVLEGDGIVGQRPSIPAGDRFSYNSYHVVATSGEARGAFYGQTEGGDRFVVPIPAFGMQVPNY